MVRSVKMLEISLRAILIKPCKTILKVDFLVLNALFVCEALTYMQQKSK